MNILKFVVLAFLPLTAVAAEPQAVSENTPVVTTILQEQLAVWPDGEAIVTTLELPANFRFSDHYHPGEEVLYILEGEGWIHYPDQPDVELTAGDAARIPAGQVHSGSTGDAGLKAVIFRVHVRGQPVRIDVTQSD